MEATIETPVAAKRVAVVEKPVISPGVRLLQLKARLDEVEKQGRAVNSAEKKMLAEIAPRGVVLTADDYSEAIDAQVEAYRTFLKDKVDRKIDLDALGGDNPRGITSIGGHYTLPDLITIYYGSVDRNGDAVPGRKEALERVKRG